MINDIDIGYFKPGNMGIVPRVLCHVATAIMIPAVMAGFCIYKISNFLGSYFGRRKRSISAMFPAYREHTAEERDAYAGFIDSVFEEIEIRGRRKNGK